MAGSLDRLQAYLARLTEQADLDRLRTILTDPRVRDDLLLRDLVCYSQFCEKDYARNLVSETRWHQMYVMCWRPGQRSSVHDHKGSACAFRVLTGECTEVRFDLRQDGLARPVLRQTFPTGSVCASADDDVHLIANLSDHEDLVTLHCYSPALIEWNSYDVDEDALAPYLTPPLEVAVIGNRARGGAPSTS